MAKPIVDSGSIVVIGGKATFDNVITKDGATYDLTGKTVTATIRRESAPSTVIDATLEGISVTVDDASNGGVTFDLTTTLSALLTAPSAAGDSIAYLVQYFVSTDSYYPQALRFHARLKMD